MHSNTITQYNYVSVYWSNLSECRLGCLQIYLYGDGNVT